MTRDEQLLQQLDRAIDEKGDLEAEVSRLRAALDRLAVNHRIEQGQLEAALAALRAEHETLQDDLEGSRMAYKEQGEELLHHIRQFDALQATVREVVPYLQHKPECESRKDWKWHVDTITGERNVVPWAYACTCGLDTVADRLAVGSQGQQT